MNNNTYFLVQKTVGTLGLIYTLLSALAGVSTWREFFITLIIIVMSTTLIFSKEVYNNLENFLGYEEDEDEDEEDL